MTEKSGFKASVGYVWWNPGTISAPMDPHETCTIYSWT